MEDANLVRDVVFGSSPSRSVSATPTVDRQPAPTTTPTADAGNERRNRRPVFVERVQPAKIQKSEDEQEAEWLRKAAGLFRKTGLSVSTNLTTVSMVVASKMDISASSDVRQMFGDTVAESVALAKARFAARDTLSSCHFGRMGVKSLAAQLTQKPLTHSTLADEVDAICNKWAEQKNDSAIHSEATAKDEVQEHSKSWKLSTPESRSHVLDKWSDIVVNYLLQDTVEYFNSLEEVPANKHERNERVSF
eukprot:TRINITY_DN3712_c0_g1_i1.p1 TRINITY_DN3712_c0_g1~~TRINITY_DN3712_c0_g1_i1.p1  ORF type:complete len:249 (+),score=43.14 TRINITY_DN3712_c0_g1_i1:217-963(+)